MAKWYDALFQHVYKITYTDTQYLFHYAEVAKPSRPVKLCAIEA